MAEQKETISFRAIMSFVKEAGISLDEVTGRTISRERTQELPKSLSNLSLQDQKALQAIKAGIGKDVTPPQTNTKNTKFTDLIKSNKNKSNDRGR